MIVGSVVKMGFFTFEVHNCGASTRVVWACMPDGCAISGCIFFNRNT